MRPPRSAPLSARAPPKAHAAATHLRQVRLQLQVLQTLLNEGDERTRGHVCAVDARLVHRALVAEAEGTVLEAWRGGDAREGASVGRRGWRSVCNPSEGGFEARRLLRTGLLQVSIDQEVDVVRGDGAHGAQPRDEAKCEEKPLRWRLLAGRRCCSLQHAAQVADCRKARAPQLPPSVSYNVRHGATTAPPAASLFLAPPQA